MHEAMMNHCVGKPIPDWDLAHRLPIDHPVGPEMFEGGTVFRSNSKYMDISEPSLIERSWFLFAYLAMWGVIIFSFCIVYWFGIRKDDFSFVFLMISVAAFIFIWLSDKFGRGLVLGLLRRPIRLHREAKKVYAVRGRRFFARQGRGDVVWEADWGPDSIFCIHAEFANVTGSMVYHIRHYDVDAQGNITRAFSMGLNWERGVGMRELLGTWNYWQTYMNQGPQSLFPPMLYLAENETPLEAFLYSLYSFGLQASAPIRLLSMPFVLTFSALRILANLTCRNPIWPEAIARISQIDADDPYDQPRGKTPVGWAQTTLASLRGEYPENPFGPTPGWSGEPDPKKNRERWLQDDPQKPLESDVAAESLPAPRKAPVKHRHRK